MANYPVNKIRNVCLMGLTAATADLMVENLLNIAGVTDRVNRSRTAARFVTLIPKRSSASFSISTAVAPVEWNGCKMSVDTPGFF